MTKAAVKELSHLGVRINAIQPGLVPPAITAVLKVTGGRHI